MTPLVRDDSAVVFVGVDVLAAQNINALGAPRGSFIGEIGGSDLTERDAARRGPIIRAPKNPQSGKRSARGHRQNFGLRRVDSVQQCKRCCHPFCAIRGIRPTGWRTKILGDRRGRRHKIAALHAIEAIRLRIVPHGDIPGAIGAAMKKLRPHTDGKRGPCRNRHGIPAIRVRDGGGFDRSDSVDDVECGATYRLDHRCRIVERAARTGNRVEGDASREHRSGRCRGGTAARGATAGAVSRT